MVLTIVQYKQTQANYHWSIEIKDLRFLQKLNECIPGTRLETEKDTHNEEHEITKIKQETKLKLAFH